MADAAFINLMSGALNRINAVEPPSSRLPRFHARHHGVGNVLWLDGHVKAQQPVYPQDLSGNLAEANLRAKRVGDIAPGGLTRNAATDDFYFLVNK